jgi:hypothetical protein
MIAVVEHVQAVEDVLRCMAVHHIQQDCDTHAVGSIYQLLEIVWRAVSTACREEAVDLVTETGIVCVLHNCHQLYGVVSQVLDARQDVLGELFVGGYFRLWGGDTDVGFVDAGTLGLRRSLVLPDVLLGRVPEARIVDGRGVQLLGNAGNPHGKTLLTGAVVGHDERYLNKHCQLPGSFWEMYRAYLDLGVMGNRGLTVLARHRHLEDAKVVLGHGRRIAVPVVEVANEVCSHGVGRPLAVQDVAVGLDMEAILLEALRT